MATLSSRTLFGLGCNHLHSTCGAMLAKRGYPASEMITIHDLRALFNLPISLLRAYCLRGCPRYWIEEEDGTISIVFHPHEFLDWLLFTRMGSYWPGFPQSLGECYREYEIDAFCRTTRDIDAVHGFALEFKKVVEYPR